ncbi:MAG: CDGSH iron-sulfur domain-containing protein [Coriobacteriia bacterium]|nr:CDGSH iron-sulfur domain-containing protein [Coriobacteriia bacterium]
MRIAVNEDGPYTVSGGVPLVRAEIVTDEAGESVAWRETGRLDVGERHMLCRCGASRTKPFCDWTHTEVGFDGTETAGHRSYMEQSVTIDGLRLLLRDARRLCAEARFCDRAGGLRNLIERCDDPEVLALAIEEAQLCPSGRYVACDPETGEPMEPELEPSIALVEDPHLGVSGPLWGRGRVRVADAEGRPYEVRNRVTLCRCGASANKPFCDGSHIASRFVDESVRQGPSG